MIVRGRRPFNPLSLREQHSPGSSLGVFAQSVPSYPWTGSAYNRQVLENRINVYRTFLRKNKDISFSGIFDDIPQWVWIGAIVAILIYLIFLRGKGAKGASALLAIP